MIDIDAEMRNALWKELLEKIQSEWSAKYKGFGAFESFPNIRGLHALSGIIHLGIEKAIQIKHGNLEGLISNSSVYRLLLNGRGFTAAHFKTLDSFSIYLGHDDWNGYKKNQNLKEPPSIKTMPHARLPLLSKTISFETYDSEKALTVLADRLTEAISVYNTRIIGNNISKVPYSKKSMVWLEALKVFVPKDGTFLKEIVSDLFIPEIQELLKLDDYKAYKLNYVGTSFLNFTVLNYRDGTKEVWIGWLLSEHKHLEQPCFVFREEIIVSLFLDWFKDLQKDSALILLT